MRADVPSALADLAQAFARLRLRWYVFDAQAVIAAGVPRLTADIDVTVEVPRGGVTKLVTALARTGIVLRRVQDVRAFIAETRVIPAVHVATSLPIDIVLAGPGLEEEMLSRARVRALGRAQIPFVDTADLVALKLLAGREKDLEDVRALVRAAPPDLSLEIARTRVAELGRLLDDSSLLAALDRVLAEAPRSPRRRPRRIATLLAPNVLSIAHRERLRDRP